MRPFDDLIVCTQLNARILISIESRQRIFRGHVAVRALLEDPRNQSKRSAAEEMTIMGLGLTGCTVH